jgi:hypothetical protein
LRGEVPLSQAQPLNNDYQHGEEKDSVFVLDQQPKVALHVHGAPVQIQTQLS